MCHHEIVKVSPAQILKQKICIIKLPTGKSLSEIKFDQHIKKDGRKEGIANGQSCCHVRDCRTRQY
jgi:hypothetical protein